MKIFDFKIKQENKAVYNILYIMHLLLILAQLILSNDITLFLGIYILVVSVIAMLCTLLNGFTAKKNYQLKSRDIALFGMHSLATTILTILCVIFDMETFNENIVVFFLINIVSWDLLILANIWKNKQ